MSIERKLFSIRRVLPSIPRVIETRLEDPEAFTNEKEAHMAADSKVIALLSACLSLGTSGAVAALAIERDR